jgi:hypothetical protein
MEEIEKTITRWRIIRIRESIEEFLKNKIYCYKGFEERQRC